MVAVEAAAHGLPTVAFAAGGVVDAVAEGRSGLLIACGEYDAFAGAVNQLLSNRGSLAVPCLEFASLFAWPRFGMRVATALGVMQAQKK
jgi:phosphatidylinositol alpha-1,6-mannosyltransferase